MRLMIWIGEEGPTDLDLKDGDVWAVKPDTWEPGSSEAKKWLNIQVAEYGGNQSELTEPEYAQGNPNPVIRRARKYFVPYWEKLTPEELVEVRNKTLTKPVNTTTFTIWDITRK